MDSCIISTMVLIIMLLFENISVDSVPTSDYSTMLNLEVTRFIELRGYLQGYPYLIFGINYNRMTLCELSRLQKILLCHHNLRIYPYRYSFSRHTHPDLSCRPQVVRIAIGSRVIFADVAAYRCPTPHYLLTFNQVPVQFHSSVSYFISGAAYPNTMILYYKHLGNAVWIEPTGLMDMANSPNLAPAEMTDRNRPYQWIPNELQFFYHDVSPYYISKFTDSVCRSPPTAEIPMVKFLDHVKNNSRVYIKFALTMNNINVCGLNKQQVGHLCRHLSRGSEYASHIKYARSTKCRKETISFVFMNYRPTPADVILCGHMYANFTVVKSFYVSTSVQPNSILSLARYLPHPEILPETIISNIKFKIPSTTSTVIPKAKATKKRIMPSLPGPARKKIIKT